MERLETDCKRSLRTTNERSAAQPQPNRKSSQPARAVDSAPSLAGFIGVYSCPLVVGNESSAKGPLVIACKPWTARYCAGDRSNESRLTSEGRLSSCLFI